MKKIRKNPLDVEGIYTYLEAFIAEESKGVKEYTKFLNYIPNHPTTLKLKNALHHILRQEKEHVEILKTFMR